MNASLSEIGTRSGQRSELERGAVAFRYLGNKTKLADWIVSVISQQLPAGASVADPMCGTASVSLALAQAGFSVTAADALRFPVIHAQARLLAKEPPRFEALGGYESALAWMNQVDPVEGYFFKEFGEAGHPANGRAARRKDITRMRKKPEIFTEIRAWNDGVNENAEFTVPRDRFNIASAARPKRDLSEKQLATARVNIAKLHDKAAA